jgi:hypothetical protein
LPKRTAAEPQQQLGLTVACRLDGVRSVKGVWWERQLAEVAAHHVSQRGHAQALVVVGGAVHLVLVDGDACRNKETSQQLAVLDKGTCAHCLAVQQEVHVAINGKVYCVLGAYVPQA